MAKYYFQTTVKHEGLNKFRVIKASSRNELNEKVAFVKAQWNEQWMRKCEVENRRQEKERQRRTAEEANTYADFLTKEAEEKVRKINEFKNSTLNVELLDKNQLKDFTVFPENEPAKPRVINIPEMPNKAAAKYNPSLPFAALFSKKKKEDFFKQNELIFQSDMDLWHKNKENVEKLNKENANKYNKLLDKWKKEKFEYEEQQRQTNESIDYYFDKFYEGKKEGIEFYYPLGIEAISVPVEYAKGVVVEYNEEIRKLIVDVLLPTKNNIPTLKKVTYIKSRNEYKEQYLSEAQVKSMYDNLIYDIVLVILNYIFKVDGGKNIDAIVLNGKIETIDASTGKMISPYILSVSVNRDNFIDLNVEYVESKAWFKSMKGISAATFATVTPVPPIVKMNKEDSRFVEGYSVIDELDESINLAAIDWQDFENLIRELFEEEFKSTGGEVKVTQASRDGGVDAIAFDPDPIRGGKIVIQAKRYTNVVGVSAVRDLYGTLMNEGATKGILVTTSDFGNDAYEFAKGKPLTLLNGANLLSLMEKHGHKAKIDIKEARNILGL